MVPGILASPTRPHPTAARAGRRISYVVVTRSMSSIIPGAAAPKLVTRDMIKDMKKGSVIVDVAIDQGGCVETAHATTHSNPVYEVDGVIPGQRCESRGAIGGEAP